MQGFMTYIDLEKWQKSMEVMLELTLRVVPLLNLDFLKMYVLK